MSYWTNEKKIIHLCVNPKINDAQFGSDQVMEVWK